jgi:hypothetical protein
VQAGEDLVAVGVALGDQAGPPPLGDLTDPPVQGPQRHGGTAQPLIEPRDRPGLGLGQQPADPLGEPGAAQSRTASSGPVGQPDDPVLVVAVDPAAHRGRVTAQQFGDRGRRPTMVRQQDHDQAGADAVGPCSRRSTSQGQPAGQERLAYTLGDAYWRRPRGVVWCVEAPTAHEATSRSATHSTQVTRRTSGHPLSRWGTVVAVLAARGRRSRGWGGVGGRRCSRPGVVRPAPAVSTAPQHRCRAWALAGPTATGSPTGARCDRHGLTRNWLQSLA